MAEDVYLKFPDDHPEYETEMLEINDKLEDYQNKLKSTYKDIVSTIGKYATQPIVAGLIGCIIPECSGNIHAMNRTEYECKSKNTGTHGWNCGEGLIQWTYWKYKIDLITKYNKTYKNSKLITDWDIYKKAKPNDNGKTLTVPKDGTHIGGMNLDEQVLFLMQYYKNIISKIKDEKNIAVIVAKLYQLKAGSGKQKNVEDPIERAYLTGEEYRRFNNSSINAYLKSVKLAYEYIGSPPIKQKEDSPVQGDLVVDTTNYGNLVVGNGLFAINSQQQTENVLIVNKEPEKQKPVTNKNVSETIKMDTTVNVKDMDEVKIISNLNSENKNTTPGILLGAHIKQKTKRG